MSVHRFSDFELDEELRQLRLRGEDVSLQPRAFDVLAYLINHRSWAVGTTRTHVQRAQGETCFAQRDLEQAVRLFREALLTVQDMDAPLEAAQARLRLADALIKLGDPECAALELESADAVLGRSEARLFMDDCRKLRAALEPAKTG